MQCYFTFRSTTELFNICIYYEMVITIILVDILSSKFLLLLPLYYIDFPTHRNQGASLKAKNQLLGIFKFVINEFLDNHRPEQAFIDMWRNESTERMWFLVHFHTSHWWDRKYRPALMILRTLSIQMLLLLSSITSVCFCAHSYTYACSCLLRIECGREKVERKEKS